MTNPNTDTVEAVARAICEACSGPFDLLSPEGQEACRVEARAAIAAMPGSGEAMREAAAKCVETALRADFERKTGMHRALSEAEVFLAAAIRELPLPQGGGSAAPAGWKLVPEDPTPEMLKAYRGALKRYIDALPDGVRLPGKRGLIVTDEIKARERYAAMLVAAPLPPAAEPYAWLCTSPELDPVIVYGRENAETYAAHPERWTVEALYRGPKFAAPLPPAQEG